MIESILRDHLLRYPDMQMQDLYKLLHQGALGSEHAIIHPEAARGWLLREVEEMGDGPAEPMVDPIQAAGEIVRIHLRPFIAAGNDVESLLDAFGRTAQEYHGENLLLEQTLQEACNMAPFPRTEMEEFARSMRAQNYPAVHHLPEYRRMYKPAYRVVALAYCPKLPQ